MSLSHLSSYSTQQPTHQTNTRKQAGLQSTQPWSSSKQAFLNPTAPLDLLALSGKQIKTWGDPVTSWSDHLSKLQQIQAFAQTAQKQLPSFSHRHYGAMVIFENGQTALGTNIEGNRQTTVCDLQSAINRALQQDISIKMQEPNHLFSENRELGNTSPTAPKIKTIYLVNADLNGVPPTPCADCQNWLNSQFCSPYTQVISLEKDPISKQIVLRSRTVKDMLPLHQGRKLVTMTTDKNLSKLPIQMSDTAKQSLEDMRIKPQFRKLLAQAKKSYREAKKQTTQTGVAVLGSPFYLIR